MKTRIIRTEIHFQDDWFNTLSIGYRYLFIYLFTNSYIGLTGAYKLPERVILLETGATKEDWIAAKGVFEKSEKVKFIGDYVIVLNAKKHSDYSGGKNEVAYKKELSSLPREVQDTLSIQYGYSIDTTINKKQEIINNKEEIRNKKRAYGPDQEFKTMGDLLRSQGFKVKAK